jgi:peptidoglycan/xylan/chitin deacetylase (PgdA/CDA1 family)
MRALGGFCPIFVLHRIAVEPTELGQSAAYLERCLELLHRYRFIPLSLPELANRLASGSPLPHKSVVFTADDGFRDQAEVAATLCARYDVPLTCFVVTDFIDGLIWPWDDQVSYIVNRTKKRQFDIDLPDASRFEYRSHGSSPPILARTLRNRLKVGVQQQLYEWLPALYSAADVEQPEAPPVKYTSMTWDDARSLQANGHVVAPHSRSHRILSQLSEAESSVEINGSIARVEAMLGKPCEVFAYPTGRSTDFTPRESACVQRAGLLAAVSTVPGAASARQDRYALPRFSLPDDQESFLQCLSFIEALSFRSGTSRSKART